MGEEAIIHLSAAKVSRYDYLKGNLGYRHIKM